MYLKEIRAHGFKSFADQTLIELDNKITGIVGPNGSGKSNVVDAIRWVLGEQSVKSLRGDGAMTDVIFSGSKSRNAANVASVTLVLDNHDNYLPLPFSEVSIKRRVYKDGTNEYYLNNEKVRLKDITDVLIDSGVGKESFNIISQGKIEEILSNKPEDRRIIFEEASGVLKYKKRKEEALRKLDKTNNNLSRINDIIKELEGQVEPLREQKEKALEFKKLNDELEKIEVALITDDITDTNYTYQENKAKIDELNLEISKLSTNNSTSEAKISEYKLKRDKLDEKIKAKQDELIKLTTLTEQLNSHKNIVLERQKYEVSDMKLHDNIVSLKEKQLKLENEISSIKLNKENILNDLNSFQSKINDLNNSINLIKQNKLKVEENLTRSLRSQNILKIKIDSLKESIENNSSVPYAVKKVLENPKLRGIHNIVNNIIEVSEKYSVAISTALASSGTNIIVDNEICAKEAINYLKLNNIGRATFFPLNIIKGKDISLDIEFDGSIGIAADLVKYDKKYENIIKNQLGNVLVVNNIDDANKLAKMINYKYRIVTLDGELLHVGGSLSGGKITIKNVILDKYELEKNIKESSKITSQIKEIENEINRLDYELKNLEDKLYIVNKDKLEKDVILTNLNQNLNTLSEEYKLTSLEISGTNNIIAQKLVDEQEQVLKDYYNALNSKNQVSNELNNLIKEKTNLNDELSDFELTLKKDNSEFNLKNDELKRLEILVNRLDVKLDNLLNSLNETYSMTYEAALEKYKLEIAPSQARNTVNSLKRQIRELGIVNMLAIEEYDKISERYEFLTSQREDLISAENTLLEIIDEMDSVMEREFSKTFKVIQENFSQTFKELFKGGSASLKLTDPNNILETGIEIVASPPGKKLTTISLLSGGEKTFTAISLLFAILKSKPVPFCVLDEVEAALDDANVDSFGKYIRSLKDKTQFILITHKKRTMEYVDVLYGITMQESGVSKLVSVKLEDIETEH